MLCNICVMLRLLSGQLIAQRLELSLKSLSVVEWGQCGWLALWLLDLHIERRCLDQ